MAVVALEGMRFFSYHGLYPEEQASGNDFTVDIYMDTGQRPLSESDEISDTPDYARAYTVVEEVMQQRQNLLETLVVRIGKRLLKEIGGIDGVRVRVSKENPPVSGECKRSYVEAEFRTGEA